MVYGCKPKADAAKRYAADTGNGLHQQKQIDQWVYDVQYRPAAEIVQSENKAGANYTPEQARARMAELKNLVYLNFYIRDATSEQSFLRLISHNQQEYEQWLKFMTGPMKQSFTLECNGQLYEPVLYHLEPAYGLSPFDKLVLAFEPAAADLQGHDLVLQYNDQILSHGVIRFRFGHQQISQTPDPAF
jgi:hypothetical protein